MLVKHLPQSRLRMRHPAASRRTDRASWGSDGPKGKRVVLFTAEGPVVAAGKGVRPRDVPLAWRFEQRVRAVSMLWVVVHHVGEKSYTLICDLAKFQPSWSRRLAAQSLQQLGADTAPPFCWQGERPSSPQERLHRQGGEFSAFERKSPIFSLG